MRLCRGNLNTLLSRINLLFAPERAANIKAGYSRKTRDLRWELWVSIKKLVLISINTFRFKPLKGGSVKLPIFHGSKPLESIKHTPSKTKCKTVIKFLASHIKLVFPFFIIMQWWDFLECFARNVSCTHFTVYKRTSSQQWGRFPFTQRRRSVFRSFVWKDFLFSVSRSLVYAARTIWAS